MVCFGKNAFQIDTGKAIYRAENADELLNLGLTIGKGKIGKRGSRFRFHLPPVQPLQGGLPVEPYALGVWLGNGTAKKPVITQGLGDEAVVEAIKALGYRISNEREQLARNDTQSTAHSMP
jgi:hypothetical protein